MLRDWIQPGLYTCLPTWAPSLAYHDTLIFESWRQSAREGTHFIHMVSVFLNHMLSSNLRRVTFLLTSRYNATKKLGKKYTCKLNNLIQSLYSYYLLALQEGLMYTRLPSNSLCTWKLPWIPPSNSLVLKLQAYITIFAKQCWGLDTRLCPCRASIQTLSIKVGVGLAEFKPMSLLSNVSLH